MNKNYEQWLRLNADYDGEILWELMDACKLIAGYIPYCDNNQHLNIELVATNNRNVATMRNILDEFCLDSQKSVRMVIREYETETLPVITHVESQFVYALDFTEWAKSKGYQIPLEIADGLKISTNEVQTNIDSTKPWLIPNPDDPAPKYDWYTPARYFARELVIDDFSLLSKRDLLSKKVSKALENAKIHKRGDLLPPSAGSVKKALANVYLA